MCGGPRQFVRAHAYLNQWGIVMRVTWTSVFSNMAEICSVPSLKLGYVISIVKISLSSLRKLKSFIIVRKGDEDYFSQKLRVRVKDNKNPPHGKFRPFLFAFFSKFSDLNFVSYVLYNLPVLCHVSQTASLEGSDIDGCMEKENITKIKYWFVIFTKMSRTWK